MIELALGWRKKIAEDRKLRAEEFKLKAEGLKYLAEAEKTMGFKQGDQHEDTHQGPLLSLCRQLLLLGLPSRLAAD